MSFFGLFGGRNCKELADKLEAVSRTQAVIEFDPDGNILHANENFLSVMDYQSTEVLGRHHSMFVDGEYARSPEYRSFWDTLRSGKHFTSEYRRLGKHNKEVWIQASYNPLIDGSGRVYKVVKFATDVTERKQSEQRNKQNAVYANALRTCQASVMLVDAELTVVYMNDKLAQLLQSHEVQIAQTKKGFSAADLFGQDLAFIYDDLANKRKEFRTLNQAQTSTFEVSGLTFVLTESPWLDQNGERLGTLIEWEDRTEELAKLDAERNTAAENARVRQALDACDTSVMIADQDLNIVYTNTAVSEMLRKRASTIKQELPNFSVESLVGTCVDDFHRDPSHQRNMLRKLTVPHRTDLRIADLTFGLIATPIFDKTGKRLGTVVEWDDKTDRLALQMKERKLAEENARVSQALNSVTSSVMIADKEANIIYLNDAATAMMKNAENDLRKALPTFNADRLNGANMDVFHQDPSHQRNLIQNLKTTYTGKAEVGGRSFVVVATPVYQEGERIGTVVEWNDRTAEVAIEKEVAEMVSAASEGDFTKQIAMENKSGFFESLGRGLNELVSTMEVATNDIMRMLGAMARGDLSERITRDYHGAFGQLKSDANQTADKLTEIIGKIRSSSGAILSASNEIAQGNADLSQRTEEQASSLEETASSMEQMTSTVKQSAENAQQANEVTQQAQDKAKEGGQVVSQAVQAMEEISSSSKKISDIIGVIDEIAFQTNLLALNAAVEAARAGEQGRGFAVVAGEVRNLAQRSAGAAKEIKDLIRDSVAKVQDGRELVNASGNTLQEIVSSVENVSAMMRDIADAAREQTSGIEQVNTAVSQMDEMTQQNAALVEQASAAGAALAEQANGMNAIVEFFSIVGDHTSVTAKQTGYVVNQAQVNSSRGFASSAPSKTPPAPAAGNYDDDEWEEF